MSTSFPWQKLHSPSRLPSPFSVLVLRATLGERVQTSMVIALSNNLGKVDRNFFCYAATVLSHIGMFSFLHRECINLHEDRLRNKIHLHSFLKGCFFCVKRFWPITRVENNSQEKFTILHVPHIGFLCYSNWDLILLHGRWLESKGEYMYCFIRSEYRQ